MGGERVSKTRPAIVWEEVRERLRQSESALADAGLPDTGRAQAIYRERAARLAAPPAASRLPEGMPVLVFQVAKERFAIELPDVVEVLATAKVAPVPGSPSTLGGVMNLRGEILPVWMLARLLGMPAAPDQATSGAAVIIVRRGRSAAGLQVDSVEEIRLLRGEELSHPDDRGPHVRGIAPDMVTVLDLKQLFEKESL